MEVIREYLLSITAAGILCAVVKSILGDKHTSGKIIQTVCGVFMAITVFSPLLHIRLNDLEKYFEKIEISAEYISQQGAEMALTEMTEIIKYQSESYILDVTASMGVDVDAEVKLSDTDPPIPKEVILSGNVSPYEKKKISQYISSNLGISEENQKWT